MKQFIFCISVLLMLSFSLTGITRSTALLRSYLRLPRAPLQTLYLSMLVLVLLIGTLAWAVPAGA